MREGELMKLRWDNVDLQAQTLHLPTTKNGDPLNMPLSAFPDLLTKRQEQLALGNSWLGRERSFCGD